MFFLFLFLFFLQISPQVSYENGWGPRLIQYNSYRTMEEKSQRQPLKRLEISPDNSPDKLAYLHNDLHYNRGLALRLADSRRSNVPPPRYARSEIGGYTSHNTNRAQSFQRHFHIGPVNDTVFDSVPNSPGVPIYQQGRNSRSLTNLLEASGSATGQVRCPIPSQVGSQHRQALQSSWHQSSYRTQSTREASQSASNASAAAEMGGKRMAMTAAMAAAAGGGAMEQERIVATGGSQLGYVYLHVVIIRSFFWFIVRALKGRPVPQW